MLSIVFRVKSFILSEALAVVFSLIIFVVQVISFAIADFECKIYTRVHIVGFIYSFVYLDCEDSLIAAGSFVIFVALYFCGEQIIIIVYSYLEQRTFQKV